MTQTIGPDHQETAAAEPVGESRQDWREHHLRHGLRGPDQADVEAVRPAVGKVAQPELHGDAHPDRADAQEATGDQQCTDGSRSRVAQVIIAGRLQHADDLPVGHASRVVPRAALIETSGLPLWLVQ